MDLEGWRSLNAKEGEAGRPPGAASTGWGRESLAPGDAVPVPRQRHPRQWAAGHFRGGAPSGLRRVPPCEGFLGRREGGSPRERRASDTTSARQRERDHGPPTPSFHQTRTVGYGRKRRRLRGSRGPRSNDVAEKGPAAVERGGGDARQTASRGSRSLDNYRDHEAKARDWAAGRGGGRIASTAGADPDSRDRRLQRWRKEGTHTYPKRSNRSLRVESRPGGSWGSVRAQRRKTRLPWSGRRGGAGAGEAKGLVVGGNSGDLSWQCAQSAPRGQDLVGGQGSPMQDRPPSGDRARQRAWGLASAQPGPPHRRGGRGGPHVGGHACRWASLRGGRGAPRAVPGTPAGRGGREAEGDGALEPAVRGSQCCRLWGTRDLAREDTGASAQADTQ